MPDQTTLHTIRRRETKHVIDNGAKLVQFNDSNGIDFNAKFILDRNLHLDEANRLHPKCIIYRGSGYDYIGGDLRYFAHQLSKEGFYLAFCWLRPAHFTAPSGVTLAHETSPLTMRAHKVKSSDGVDMDEQVDPAFRELEFRVARGQDREGALQLRRDVCARDWPAVPSERVVDLADATAVQLIACAGDGQIVASLRVVPWSQRPFDLERFISLHALLPEGRQPAEIGRFCISAGNRYIRRGAFVHLGMLKLAFELAKKLEISDYLMTAVSRYSGLYRLGGFRETGLRFDHPEWGGVDVMRIDLSNIDGLRSPIRRILESPQSNVRVD